MKIMNVHKIFTAVLFLTFWAGATNWAGAQSAGSFTQMGFSARGIAMGNALVADNFGETSAYYNPGAAPFLAEQHLELTYSALTFDRNLQFLNFSTPMKPQAGLTIGLIHAGVSNFDGRDNSGYHTGTFGINEYAVFAGFGTRVSEKVGLGIRFTYHAADYYENVEPAKGLGLSLGMSIKASPQVRLGFTVDDLIAKNLWDTGTLYEENGKETSDAYPTRLRVGAAYQLMQGKLLLTAESQTNVAKRTYTSAAAGLNGGESVDLSETTTLRLAAEQLKLGAEYQLAEPFTLRAGVDRIGQGALPSLGFGLKQKFGELRLRLDYAFKLEPYQTGTMHLLSVRMGL